MSPRRPPGGAGHPLWQPESRASYRSLGLLAPESLPAARSNDSSDGLEVDQDADSGICVSKQGGDVTGRSGSRPSLISA